jgi:hypothetical protein
MTEDEHRKLGDEEPEWKHVIIIIIVTAMLIALSWITWCKFGWFH